MKPGSRKQIPADPTAPTPMKITQSTRRRTRVLSCVMLGALALANATAQVLDFKALEARQLFGNDGVPQSKWTDADTGAAIFNLAFTSDGVVRGANQLPGSADLELPTAASKYRISLKFLPGSKGVAALTLTSRDGKIRLRFHQDRDTIVFAWRNRNVSEQAMQFRRLSATPTGDAKTMVLTLDVAGNQIEFNDGETVDVVKAKENDAPDIVVADFQKVTASVEGETALQELKIEEL